MFQSLLSELRQNFRLRLGVWVILALTMSYVVLVLNDYRKHLQQDYQEALTRLHQLHLIAKQTQWSQRAKQAQELRGQLEARLWQANSKGLAQAMIQSWLQEEVYFARIEEPRSQVETAQVVPKHPQLWQVTAKLDGIFVPKRLQSLLSTIGQSRQLVIIERLDIRYSNTSRFTLVFSAYFAATGSGA